MKLTRIAALLLALLLGNGQARAWNSTGHMAIALLAWRQLDPSQRQAAHQLLRAHPHYVRYLAQHRPEEAAADEWAFLRAATWPDWVRGSREHHEHDLKPFHHATWHYINLPFVAPGETGAFSAAELTPGSPNIVTVLNETCAALGGRQADDQQRAIRFCWLLHLVGDIHQPLHCASLVSRRYPPPYGDEGGNRLAITPHKRPESLHTYWDRLLGANAHYRALDQLVKRIGSTAKNHRDLAERLSAHTTVQSWADEGLLAAIEFAYLEGHLPIVDYREVERGDISESEVPVLPAGYASEAREIARLQAALAGQRLAAILNQIVPKR
jgi:hypothetical protein